MRIIICEDDDRYAIQLINHINDWSRSMDVFVEVFTYNTAEKFLFEWEENENYDLLFLDIKMGKISGMELARIIRKTNNDVAIVFVTSMKEYVLKGYSVAAMQYLLKPVKKEECFACLNKVHQNGRVKKYFLVNDADKIVKIPHEHIIFIAMFSHNAILHTPKREYTFRKTIGNILHELNDDLFIKCHKSFIINIRHIEAVSKTIAFMSNEIEVPLSKNIAKEISDRFLKYNINKA